MARAKLDSSVPSKTASEVLFWKSANNTFTVGWTAVVELPGELDDHFTITAIVMSPASTKLATAQITFCEIRGAEGKTTLPPLKALRSLSRSSTV